MQLIRPLLALTAGLALCAALPSQPHDTELAESMELVEETVGKLRRSLRDPEQLQTSLELVDGLQAVIMGCKLEQPSMTESLPEADRAAFVNEFRIEMAMLMTRSLELEIALRQGDNEAADAAFKALRRMEEPGHERFTREDE